MAGQSGSTYAEGATVLATHATQEIVHVEACVFEHFQEINYYRAGLP